MKRLCNLLSALLLFSASAICASAQNTVVKNGQLTGSGQVPTGATLTINGTLAIGGGGSITGLPTTDATLTALAGLTTSANKISLWTGTDTASVIDFTALAQTFAGYTTAAEYRNAIFPGSGAEGDLITHDGTNWIRQAIGTEGQVPVVQADGTWAWDDMAISVDAEDIAYDNATSALTATDVQAAIDEVAARKRLFESRSAKTSAYTVVAADRGAMIDCTSGTFSVSFTAAATLGAGFHVVVYNSGSGTITLDPNSSETIRDPSSSATTKTLAQGAGVVLVCDGSGFLVVANATAGGATGTVTFSSNTITGTTSGNTELTTSVSNADVRLLPNGTGHVVINPRSVIEGITSGNYGLYIRGNVGSGNGIFIAGDTGDQARGNNIGARIGFIDDGAYGDHIDFLTKSTGGSSTTTGHRVRITSGSSTGGNLLIGTTSTTGLTGSGGLVVASTTASTTTATGAAIIGGGLGVGGRTSTATLSVGGTNGTAGDLIASATATLDFPSIAATGGTQDLTITVTGAATGDAVFIGLPSAPSAGVVFHGHVSASNTVTIRATNTTAGAIDPTSATYRAVVFSY